MTVRALPDVEQLVVEALRAAGDVADLVDTRVYTRIPPHATYPLVRVVRISGTRTWPRHVDIARLQIDAWAALEEDGGTKRDAWLLIDTVTAAMTALPGIHDEGVVVAVEDGAGPAWLPDDTTNQPRYSWDCLVHARAHRQGEGS